MSEFVPCRGCGAQLHVTALTCPKCGAPQSSTVAASKPMSPTVASASSVVHPTSYSQTPWFRRRWFVLLCALTVSPIAGLLAATGDLYYSAKDGVVKTLPANFKTAFYFLSVGWTVNLFMPDGSASSVLFVVGAIVLALVVGLRK